MTIALTLLQHAIAINGANLAVPEIMLTYVIAFQLPKLLVFEKLVKQEPYAARQLFRFWKVQRLNLLRFQ